MIRLLAPLLFAVSIAHAQPVTMRVVAFNVQDVRPSDLADAAHPRLKHLAEVIQRVRPNIILLNEIACSMPGSPGFQEGMPPDSNARRFVDLYLSTPQAPELGPLTYRVFAAPVNSGVCSGFDLDNNGRAVKSYPDPRGGPDRGAPHPEPGPEARDYGNDCWGFGAFPGQYGMALLVAEPLEVLAEQARTFQRLPWDYMPGAFLPTKEDGTPWYSDEERALMRLSSKSHWDVPVRLPGGAVVHLLCSHPTPPAFDGPEMRNKKRNHDEIRFWADYVSDASYIVDDAGRDGGLRAGQSWIILGDLNADADEGDSFKNPITNLLGSISRLNLGDVPLADIDAGSLSRDDTASFGMRVDYVLPSTDLEWLRGGVYRAIPSGAKAFPSDHFPVWVDVRVPAARP